MPALIAIEAIATARIWLAPPLSSEVENFTLIPSRAPICW
jgi:hypothetical protein